VDAAHHVAGNDVQSAGILDPIVNKLKELEQRLRDEPDNLGLRVMVAGALHEAGRRDDAIEIYRSVAIAYRDQGRPQQAITVCRSILELAPGDVPCQELLAALMASQQAPRASPPPRPSPSPMPGARPSPVPGARPAPVPGRPSPGRLPSPDPEPRDADPVRRSSGEMTPLPAPLAYHEADPTTGSLQRLSPSDLPPSLREELAAYPEIAGIAAAARQISASLIAANRRAEETAEIAEEDFDADHDTGRLMRGGPRAAPSASVPPPPPTPSPPLPRPPSPALASSGADPDDDEPTLPPPPPISAPRSGTLDDEKTEPRELPTRVRPPSIDSAPQTTATGPLAGAFFAPLPPRNRGAVLQRFRRRMLAAGTAVIRRGETGHGLIVVVRGRLDLHAERGDGSRVLLGSIGPGDFIGEASLLARAPAAVHVVVGADCELLVLGPDDFYDITNAFPALRTELETIADRRARDHEQRLG
jgi:hypothetical protein